MKKLYIIYIIHLVLYIKKKKNNMHIILQRKYITILMLEKKSTYQNEPLSVIL